jgi:hypothetical protein
MVPYHCRAKYSMASWIKRLPPDGMDGQPRAGCPSVSGSLNPAQRGLVIRYEWRTWGYGVPLLVLYSPYRSIVQPLLHYIEQIQDESPDQIVTVILPEFVPAKWWQHFLHSQTALQIKGALLFKKGVVTSVPYHLRR